MIEIVGEAMFSNGEKGDPITGKSAKTLGKFPPGKFLCGHWKPTPCGTPMQVSLLEASCVTKVVNAENRVGRGLVGSANGGRARPDHRESVQYHL